MMRLLMVCTGNICRSPTAEGVVRKLIAEAGLSGEIEIDSAGLYSGHGGSRPDIRARMVAEQNGYDISELRSRPLKPEDYGDFDLILGMDKGHISEMREECPLPLIDKIRLYLDFTPEMVGQEVPDPYTGDADDFTLAFELIEQGAEGLVDQIIEQKPYLAYR
ncbi:MAG: low molecular weight phosphotyrosine protein phosphatase [Rhodospirillaceae bacterium]|jgi:protein-tyrosine phosphatase|nr:low molecular weight phosphotyrosine protein phosphatase [Rhodospirillaceae bacterium]